jgi:hypothetical protein
MRAHPGLPIALKIHALHVCHWGDPASSAAAAAAAVGRRQPAAMPHRGARTPVASASHDTPSAVSTRPSTGSSRCSSTSRRSAATRQRRPPRMMRTAASSSAQRRCRTRRVSMRAAPSGAPCRWTCGALAAARPREQQCRWAPAQRRTPHPPRASAARRWISGTTHAGPGGCVGARRLKQQRGTTGIRAHSVGGNSAPPVLPPPPLITVRLLLLLQELAGRPGHDHD